MKKWLIVGLGVIAILIWQTVDIYRDAVSYKYAGAAKARQAAESRYEIKKINGVDYFHGERAYPVVDAVLDDGKRVYIWVPDGKGKMFSAPVSSGYDKREILNAFSQHVRFKRIVSAKLGAVDDRPAWEIVYYDEKNRYVFSYYDFYTGKSLIDPIALQ